MSDPPTSYVVSDSLWTRLFWAFCLLYIGLGIVVLLLCFCLMMLDFASGNGNSAQFVAFSVLVCVAVYSSRDGVSILLYAGRVEVVPGRGVLVNYLRGPLDGAKSSEVFPTPLYIERVKITRLSKLYGPEDQLVAWFFRDNAAIEAAISRGDILPLS